MSWTLPKPYPAHHSGVHRQTAPVASPISPCPLLMFILAQQRQDLCPANCNGGHTYCFPQITHSLQTIDASALTISHCLPPAFYISNVCAYSFSAILTLLGFNTERLCNFSIDFISQGWVMIGKALLCSPALSNSANKTSQYNLDSSHFKHVIFRH